MSWMYFKTITYAPPINARLVRRAQREAFRSAAKFWHRSIRPKHFKMSAFNEYDYAKRSPEYEKRKRKKKHHNLPLVMTGKSRQLSRMHRITATYKGARITMNVPALNLVRVEQGGRAGAPAPAARMTDLRTGREEFEQFSSEDERRVVKHFARQVDQSLRAEGRSSRIKRVKLVSAGMF